MKTTTKVTLHYTRHFVRGNLKGLNHEETLKFTNLKRAMDWVNGIRSNTAAGKLDYQLAGYSFRD